MKVSFDNALSLLKAGEVCAIPTETVYGLAARFDNLHAVKQVFEIKQRPLDHPLIVHIAKTTPVNQLAKDLPVYLPRLLSACWPGPLTVVLKKTDAVSDAITAGQNTVALRMPAHPLVLDLIQQLNTPIVAPSANRFCQASPTTAAHVEAGLGQDIPVLDGGACDIGIESTIVLATDPKAISILRPGMLSSEQLADIAGVPCQAKSTNTIKTPGQHKVHYQPKKNLWLLENTDDMLTISKLQNLHFVCLLQNTFRPPKHCKVINMPKIPDDYAKILYDTWHQPSILAADHILIELPPDTPAWQGLRDRIMKASSGYARDLRETQ